MSNTSKTRGAAAAGLAVYGLGIGWFPTTEDDAGMSTLLADFLADLMFSCQEVEMDFEDALERAREYVASGEDGWEGTINESHQASLDLIASIAEGL